MILRAGAHDFYTFWPEMAGNGRNRASLPPVSISISNNRCKNQQTCRPKNLQFVWQDSAGKRMASDRQVQSEEVHAAAKSGRIKVFPLKT